MRMVVRRILTGMFCLAVSGGFILAPAAGIQGPSPSGAVLSRPALQHQSTVRAVQFQKTTGPLQAGIGIADTTPPIGVPMGGYGGRIDPTSASNPLLDPNDYAKLFLPTQGAHDRLRAKTLVMDNGGNRFAFVSLDLIGVTQDVFELIGNGVEANPSWGLTKNQLFISATHSHSALGSYATNPIAIVLTDFYDQRVSDFLVGKVVESIGTAVANLQPATFGAGEGPVQGLTGNRRGDAIVEESIGVMRVDRLDGTPLAVMMNFPVHGTSIDSDIPLFSADVMGASEHYIEQELGNGCLGLFFNGAEGDISPNSGGFRDFDRLPWWGKTFGDAVLAARNVITTTGVVTMDAAVEEALHLPPAYIRPALTLDGFPLDFTVPLGPPLVPATSRLSVARMNDLAIGTMPGEAIVVLGKQWKDRTRQFAPFQHAFFLGLCNDHLLYFTTPEEYWQGDYEAFMSFLGPDGGQILIDVSIDLVRALASR